MHISCTQITDRNYILAALRVVHEFQIFITSSSHTCLAPEPSKSFIYTASISESLFTLALDPPLAAPSRPIVGAAGKCSPPLLNDAAAVNKSSGCRLTMACGTSSRRTTPFGSVCVYASGWSLAGFERFGSFLRKYHRRKAPPTMRIKPTMPAMITPASFPPLRAAAGGGGVGVGVGDELDRGGKSAGSMHPDWQPYFLKQLAHAFRIRL